MDISKYGALIDLSKATDSKDHKFLKLKLSSLGFSESAIESIYQQQAIKKFSITVCLKEQSEKL